jgi:very-short-patch-repair endonuclease
MATRKFTRRSVPPPLRRAALRLHAGATDAENKLWLLLRDRRLAGLKFRRQVPIGPYIADFVSFPARLIVEVDGGQHADSVRDAERDQWLAGEKFKIVRYWNNDVLQNPDGVLTDLLSHLDSQ